MPVPLLVTGSIRSGTTWVGRMLCLSRQLGYIHEPFNPWRWPGWAAQRFPHELVYINSENEATYYPVLQDIINMRFPLIRHLSEIRDPRHVWRLIRDWQRSVRYAICEYQPLLKDPDALFSAEWLAKRFEMRVVVLIRHPAGFASSVKRLNCALLPSPWVWQAALMRDYLSPFEQELQRFKSRNDTDIMDQAVLTWKSLYSVVRLYQERHPEWIFVRHEDLTRDPQQQFRQLYDRLGLRWDDRVRAGIDKYTTSANPAEVSPSHSRTIRRDSHSAALTWLSRLTKEEIERVYAGTADVGRYFYSDAEWNPIPKPM